MKFRKMNSGIRGFTLIELLVVIAIIGILAGMLLPALSKARAQGQSANCVSSLHQWGLACTMYMDDNDELIPLDTESGGSDTPTWGQVTGAASTSTWYNVLMPYVQKPTVASYSATPGFLYQGGTILQCPSTKWSGKESFAAGPRFSYAYNSKIIDSGHPTVRLRDLESPHQGGNVNNRPVNSTTVAMLIDTRASTTEPRVFPAESDTKVGSPHSYTKRLSNRHSGRFNVVFFDGSVRTYDPALLMDSIGQNVSTSPVIWSPWNPDAS